MIKQFRLGVSSDEECPNDPFRFQVSGEAAEYTAFSELLDQNTACK